ncbi:hypothetical protein PDESU_05803 [Pontiella desulfatans]|uniref:Uncharacterized protein n=1 Tax=Pontiella desulfatans TaxID=2750659 RepID=A0A6C2UC89_PONDE|nr:hypothetical protein [Pontiella desulfatans]VGO17207.1 hypothetical protein PDESU_05803 [Pontiella desulfatans]
MNNFQEPTVPNIPAPHVRAWCHRCGTDTGTTFKTALAAGIGNCCAECGACRKGRPYISKRDFQSLMRDRAEGAIHANTQRLD